MTSGAGNRCSKCDPSQGPRSHCSASRADYESVRHSVDRLRGHRRGSARLVAGCAGRCASRLEQGCDASGGDRTPEDRGAISVRRLEIAQATRIERAGSIEKAAEADLRKAQEAAGAAGDENAQLRSAATAKAELDLSHYPDSRALRGLITDLRTDVGHFAHAGAPAMTLIAIHDLWIDADMTENNLGNIEPGDEVAIVLDVLPGEVLKGRVRSVGNGVSSGQPAPPGTLPTIQNSRDWLRQAQRFPVAIEFDTSDAERLRKVRVGGQAEVMVFTGDNFVMNTLGAAYIRLKSWLSYLY